MTSLAVGVERGQCRNQYIRSIFSLERTDIEVAVVFLIASALSLGDDVTVKATSLSAKTRPFASALTSYLASIQPMTALHIARDLAFPKARIAG